MTNSMASARRKLIHQLALINESDAYIIIISCTKRHAKALVIDRSY